MLLHIRSGKRKPLFNETYNWLLLVNKLWSAHIRSGKRKPLFNETYFIRNNFLTSGCILILGLPHDVCTYRVWKMEMLLLVTPQLYAHIRSRKRKPLFNETYNWLLLVTTLWSAHIRSRKRKPLFNETFN